MNAILSLPLAYRLVLTIALVILCISLGYSAYSYTQNTKKSEALAILTKIDTIQNKSDKIQALINAEKELPQSMITAIALEVANNAMQENIFTEAQKQYALVTQSKDAIRVIGILGEAKALLQDKKAEEAIAILQPVVKTLPNEIKALVLLTLAEAQEEANRIEDAIATYTQIVAIDTNSYGYVQYKLDTLKK